MVLGLYSAGGGNSVVVLGLQCWRWWQCGGLRSIVLEVVAV